MLNLRTLVLDGFAIIRDNESCHGEGLAFALLRSPKSVLVLTIPGREVVLRRRYAAVCDSAIFVCFEPDCSMEDVFVRMVHHTPSHCFLDCLDVLVEVFSTEAIAGLISRLKVKCSVLTICSECSLDEEEFSRLCFVANLIIKIRRHGGYCLSDITQYKRNGKYTSVTEKFTVSDALELSSEKFVLSDVSSTLSKDDLYRAVGVEQSVSDRETDGKSQSLPFTSISRQNELNNLRLADRKVRVGGQIIYVPDKDDDLDDSDPDDDLDL